MTTVTSTVARRTADSPATPAVLGYAVLAPVVMALPSCPLVSRRQANSGRQRWTRQDTRDVHFAHSTGGWRMPNSLAAHVSGVPAALPSAASPGGDSNRDQVTGPGHAAHDSVLEIHHEPTAQRAPRAAANLHQSAAAPGTPSAAGTAAGR